MPRKPPDLAIGVLGQKKLPRWVLIGGPLVESEGSMDSVEQLRGPESAGLEVQLRLGARSSEGPHALNGVSQKRLSR